MPEATPTAGKTKKETEAGKMNAVRRANVLRRMVRRIVFRMPERKYVTAGDRACRELMRGSRRNPDPSDDSILAWALYDLRKEILEGFWDRNAMYLI